MFQVDKFACARNSRATSPRLEPHHRVRLVLGAVLLLTSFLGSSASALDVIRGPYLQQGTPESIIVRWRTDASSDAEVRYGTSPGSLDQSVVGSEVGTEHEVTVTGLAADTTYYYAVGSTTQDLAGGSNDYRFVTSPDTGTARRTRIWVVGDSGTANGNARDVRDAYLAHPGADGTHLMLMLGDNAYDDGTDSQYQNAVFDTYPTILRNTVVWPTLGNHDGSTADSGSQSGPYYEIFSLPRSGEAGGLASGTEAYYSFDYGNIHFVCLDSHDTNRSPSGAMMSWLEEDLAGTVQDWVIAYWHHPPYSKGSHNSDSEGRLVDMREAALPILESHGVDLVLSGHSHAYERSFLLDGHYGSSSSLSSAHIIDGGDGREGGDGAYTKEPDTPNDGAVYVVAGSSGRVSSSGSLNHPAMFISLRELGSLVLDIDGNRMDVEFLRENRSTPDHFTIVKGGGEPPPPPPPDENQAPVVSAGPDQNLVLPATATLNGTVNDDGLPNGLVTTQWTQVSGPASVTFADAAAVDTTASFSDPGTYVLRLSADDGDLSASDETTITVSTSGSGEPSDTTEIRVQASADDAEEAAGGRVRLTSTDLELVFDANSNQTVGMRFNAIPIPQGASIVNAYIQFQVDETNSEATTLTIRGEAADNAAAFSSSSGNVSSRDTTTAAITWSPAPWTTAGAAGIEQRTPNIAPVVGEIVGRAGWSDGNSLVVLVSGTGERGAESFDGDSNGAPLLHIEYIAGGEPPPPPPPPPEDNQAPVTSAGSDQSVTLPNEAVLSGTASDDGLPNPPAALSANWSVASGPGTVTFADPQALATTASFSEEGTYVLRLSADDGALVTSDEVTVTVQAVSGENFGLSVSTSSNRSSPVDLDGAVVSRGDQIFVFVTPLQPESNITRVGYFIDGNFEKTEYAAPYDLAGTRRSGNAFSFNAGILSLGSHTIRADVVLESGEVLSVAASFEAQGGSGIGDND